MQTLPAPGTGCPPLLVGVVAPPLLARCITSLFAGLAAEGDRVCHCLLTEAASPPPVTYRAPDVVLLASTGPAAVSVPAWLQSDAFLTGVPVALLCDAAAEGDPLPGIACLLSWDDRSDTFVAGLADAAAGLTFRSPHLRPRPRSAPDEGTDVSTTVRPPAVSGRLPRIANRKAGATSSSASEAEPGGLPGLTARERDVALAIARGLSNREAAASLGVGEDTLKTHLKSVFRKFQVGRRSQLVAAVAACYGGAENMLRHHPNG